jgi:hypothetical protein
VSSEWHFLGRAADGVSVVRFGHWTWRGDLSKIAFVGVGDEGLSVSPPSPLPFSSFSHSGGDDEVHVSGQAARRRVLLVTASARGQVRVMASAQRRRLSPLLKRCPVTVRGI